MADINITAAISGISGIKDGLSAASKATQGLSDKVVALGKATTGLGQSLSKNVTLPLAAAAAGAVALANEFEKAENDISIATGKTGSALTGLQRTAKNVFTSIPTDIAATSKVVGSLATRTELTGSTFDTVAKQILESARMMKFDAGSFTDSFGRAIKQMGVESQDASKFLDAMFRVSQEYGIALPAMTSTMEAYGAVLKNSGLSANESAAFIARFETAGISVSRVLPGVNAAVRRMASEGKNLRESLNAAIIAIANTEDHTAALDLATKTFGAEGAQRMLKAIKLGILPSLDDLGTSVRNSSGLILQYGETHRTFSERAVVLWNQFKSAIAPIGVELTKVFKTVIEPVLGSAIRVIGDLVQAFVALPQPIKVAIGTIVALIGVGGPFLIALGGMITALGLVSGAFTTMMVTALAALSPILVPIAAVGAAITAVLAIMASFIGGWNEVNAFLGHVQNRFNTLAGFFTWFGKHFDSIFVDAFTRTINYYKGVWNGLMDMIPASVKSSLGLAKAEMSNGATGIINANEALRSASQTKWGQIGQSVGGATKGIVANMADIVRGATSTSNNMGNQIDGLKTRVSNSFVAMGTQVQNAATSMGNNVGSVTRNMVNGVTSEVSRGSTNVVNGFVNMGNGVWRAVSGTSSQVTNAYSNMTNGMVNSVSNGANSVSNIFGSLGNNVARSVSTLGANVVNQTNNMTNGMTNAANSGANSIINAFYNMGTGVSRAVSSTSGQVASTGQSMMATLSNSVSNGANGVINSFYGMTNGVVRAMDSTRTNVQYGAQTMMGNIANTVSGGSNSVINAFYGLNNGVSRAIESTSSSARYGAQAMMNGMASAVSNGSGNVINSFYSFSNQFQQGMNTLSNNTRNTGYTMMQALGSSISTGGSAVVRSVSGFTSSVTRSMTTMSTQVQAQWGSMVKGITRWVNQLPDVKIKKFEDSLTGMLENFTGMDVNQSKLVSSTLKFFNDLPTKGSAAFTTYGNTVISTLQGMGGKIGAVTDLLVSLAGNEGTAGLLGNMMSGVSGLMNGLTGLFDGMKGGIGGIFNTLKNAFNGVMNILGSVGTGITNVISSIGGLFGGGGGGTGLGGILGTIGSAAGGLMSGAGNVLGSVVGFGSGTAADVFGGIFGEGGLNITGGQGFFSNLGSNVMELGKTAVSGIAGGFIGTSVGEAIFGKEASGFGSVAGGILGSILPGIGTFLGAALGGFIDAAFGNEPDHPGYTLDTDARYAPNQQIAHNELWKAYLSPFGAVNFATRNKPFQGGNWESDAAGLASLFDAFQLAETLFASVLPADMIASIKPTLSRSQIVRDNTLDVSDWFSDRWSGIFRALEGQDALLGTALAALTPLEANPLGSAVAGIILDALSSTSSTRIDGSFQTGGQRVFASPSLIEVGETGPELVTVQPLAGRKAGGGISINMQGPTFIDQMGMDQFVNQLADKLAIRSRRGY